MFFATSRFTIDKNLTIKRLVEKNQVGTGLALAADGALMEVHMFLLVRVQFGHWLDEDLRKLRHAFDLGATIWFVHWFPQKKVFSCSHY